MRRRRTREGESGLVGGSAARALAVGTPRCVLCCTTASLRALFSCEQAEEQGENDRGEQ